MTDFTETDGRLVDWIDEHQAEIVQAVQTLIRIPSVKGEPAADAPFGSETRRGLENVLEISARYGFSNKMLDGYAAHAEFGAGEEMIGVLAHVDVVPAGSDWKHEPFGAQLEDGKIFGRGAIDDKGPCIAGLYALVAMKETAAPISKRLRLIIGADEESGFSCMDHYFNVAREEMPVMGFTPDGRFPLIYAEKGIASPTLVATIPPQDGEVRLTRMSAGERSNMVPDRAEAKLAGMPEALASIRKRIQDVPNVTCASEGTGLVVKAVGVSAHAMMPEGGVNAVKLLTTALLMAPELSGLSQALTTLKNWATDTTGGHLGIAGSDDVTGALTANLGVLTFDGNKISATFSIRHPVTWSEDEMRNKIQRGAAAAGFELAGWGHYGNPLYAPLDSPLISTLLGVYRDETGDMSEPATTGGGTYARVLTQGVAFGPNFPGFPDNAHQADEYWTVEDLMKATKIYAKALARLAS